jgi:hypothetical protein
MYTIDEFIERLQELRMFAKAGGKTPVAIDDTSLCYSNLRPANAGLIPATERMQKGELAGWNSSLSSNTTEIVRVF